MTELAAALALLSVVAGWLASEIRRAAAETRAAEAQARAILAATELGAARERDARRRRDVWRLVELMHEDRQAGETWRTAGHIQRMLDDEEPVRRQDGALGR